MAIIRRGICKRESKVIGAKLPAELYDKLTSKHPGRGEISFVLRALVQKYLDGKINNLEFTITETL